MYDDLSKLISLSESDQTLYYTMSQRQQAFSSIMYGIS
jgi:hypothetical protein